MPKPRLDSLKLIKLKASTGVAMPYVFRTLVLSDQC